MQTRLAKTFQNQAMRRLRDDRKCTRADQRALEANDLLIRYERSALPVEDLYVESLPWFRAPLAVIPEYNCVTTRIFFREKLWAKLCGDLLKLREKRVQIDHIVSALRGQLGTCRRVVDFGGGTGNLALAIAWTLGSDVEVVVVEQNAALVEQGRARVAACGLNVRFVCDDLRNFSEDFGFAVACHACGGLIDEILHLCLLRGARFLLLTCCFGKILQCELPRTPSLCREDFASMCRLADSSDQTLSAQAMCLVNSDRIRYVTSHGGSAHLIAIPRRFTNKNMFISGDASASGKTLEPERGAGRTQDELAPPSC